MTTVVLVQQGGTGSNNAADARSALGAAPSAAYDKANSALEQANAAYNAANNAQVTVYANNASNVTTQNINFVNTSTITVAVSVDGSNANVAFTAVGGAAYDQANAAYAQANLAYAAANNSNLKSGGLISGTLNVTNDMIVGGNIYLQGNTTFINVATYQVNDPLMYIAANNILTDSVDIGFVGAKNTSGTFSHTGLARDATDGKYKLFDNLPDSGHVGNVIDFANSTIATLVTNVEANTLTLGGNTVATQANLTLAHNQANSAYGAANNRVLKSGDTMTGNLTFSGTGLRILGDMSNETIANRLMFQTSVPDNTTNLGLMPNGNGVFTLIQLYSTSNPADSSSTLDLRLESGGDARIRSGNTGNGAYLPLTFYTGGSERMRLDTNGNIGIGGTPASNDKVLITGTLPATANSTRVLPVRGTIPSTALQDCYVFESNPSTQAATFTLNNIQHFRAGGVTLGANSAIGIQYGFIVPSVFPVANAINYGFFSNISSGENRWNFYASGTANNYFASNIGIGTTSPTSNLHVVGSGSFDAGNMLIGASAPYGKFTIANNSLGTTIDSTRELFRISTSTGNGDLLEFFKLRTSAGSDWTTAGWRIQQKVDATWHGYIQFNGNNNEGLSFGTGGSTVSPRSVTERIRIDNNGNVGIGTTSPESRLHVSAGHIRLDNNYFLYGENSVGSASVLIGRNSSDELIVGDASFNNPTKIRSGNNFVSIETNSSERVRVTSAGDIGIGTTPSYRLHVATTAPTNNIIAYLVNSQGGSTKARIGMQDASTTYAPDFGCVGDNITFETVGVERMRITSAGSVGIGTASPSTTLDVNGTITCTTLTETSSIAFKENVDPITDALNSITKLVGVTYDRKDGSVKQKAGLIAEEVEKVLPNLVQKDNDGNAYGIHYTNLIAYLVESIKELNNKIERLESNR